MDEVSGRKVSNFLNSLTPGKHCPLEFNQNICLGRGSEFDNFMEFTWGYLGGGGGGEMLTLEID